MKNVAKIIELFAGLNWLREASNYIRLENPPLMRLVIEHIGEGSRGLPAISVAHYYEQNGDQMRDPEMIFEVASQSGEWLPVSFQQDNLDMYQKAVFADNGQVVLRPKLLQDLKSFARQWDTNIEQQGFLKVAQGGGR